MGKGQVSYIYQPYRLDWGQVTAFACDFADAQKEWQRCRVRNPYADIRRPEYRNFVAAEFQLWGIANVLGIPMYVLVMAARIERKYYRRGGLRGLDYERLIVGLDCNRREYE